ncbi:hypothetical protein GUITHDRAFT_68515 [Guillardia theta CCMP2712]|uniref:Uncharacterized protein n=1 Tax=Guillardia theta (strain CCMP2712) TaxID=905079 RepID=L1JL45_GUITC|nr:hypothetical protein GUITHDRAFT_68515 [Guillardia theta CCMP2712]EKX48780.1 hypothetical protein GUITHDRAFT_68515 [Guillardia theta CCMP2712]|eukprot:XP_005835760.1 hypothetical protein GUITHDRAFT_68515 [Guillardia theta CCMP2712]
MCQQTDRADIDNRIFSLAIPALGSLAIDPLLGLVDTLYLGRIPSPSPLAALGVCSSIFNYAFFIFNFFATATTPLISRALAAGEKEEAAETLAQALTAAALLGVSTVGLLEFFSHGIIESMGTIGNGAFRGLQDTRTPLLILLVANLVNFVLDPLFIYGVNINSGAGLATAIAEWISAGLFMGTLRQREAVTSSLMSMPASRLHGRDEHPLLVASGAVFLRSIALQSVLTFATSQAARTGTEAVAAHQVGLQVWLLMSFAVDSLAVAAQTLIAEELGKGSKRDARVIADRLTTLAAQIGLLLMLAFLASSSFLPKVFTADAKVDEIVQHLLLYISVMQPINALVFVGDGILQGSEDFAFLTKAMFVAAASSLLVLLAGEGIDGVWSGLVVLQVMRAAGLGWRYYGGKAAGGPLNVE